MARITWVVLALVVLNIALYLWPSKPVQGKRPEVEVNTGSLALISENPPRIEPLPPGSEQSGQAEPDQIEPGRAEPGQAEPGWVEPDQETASQTAAGTGQAGVTPVTEAQVPEVASCYKIGPFININSFNMARARLAELQIPFRLDQVAARSANVVRLYFGPFDSRDAAVAAQNDLRGRGLLDHFVKPDGDNWLVSIGVFAQQSRAETRMQQLQVRAPEVRMRTEYEDIPPNSWIIIDKIALTRDLENQLILVPWHQSGVELASDPCDDPLVSDEQAVLDAG